MSLRPLDLPSLARFYAEDGNPAEVLNGIYAQIAGSGARPVWITLVPEGQALEKLEEAKRRHAAGEALPLFGIPFAVKDNIDVAGLPTTAACPSFAYVPARSATVVERLEAAGAILVGKTNLDQFATGLNGTRSPYGIPSCVFDDRYISGGSSSGSAVAVAAGLVSFSLGTDTAGSGRVPASFNNIVGLKPTKGWLSTRGVVPACRSLDCVSIFAGSVGEALQIAGIAGGFDPEDPFSRRAVRSQRAWSGEFRFGMPATADFFGDDAAAALYADAAARLEAIGGTRIEIDLSPFLDAAELLYAGPWLAERLAAVQNFAATNAGEMNAVVRDIIQGGSNFTAVDAFEGVYRLAELTRRAEAEWAKMDVLLLPTAGTIYRIEQLLAEPVRLNSNLGVYTNFVNLMDLSAIAIPAGFRSNGLPFGVTIVGRAFEDSAVALLADRLHRSLPIPTIGATGYQLPSNPVEPDLPDRITLAVVGAHLSGQPLNHQLTERGGQLVRKSRTASGYSLYALSGSAPSRPGLVFDGRGKGGIELEVWAMPMAAVGSFLAGIAPPLGIGTVRLEDGSSVQGFLCEAHAVADEEEITQLGGWRAYLESLKAPA